jgi:hypothetical protein
LKYFDIFIIFQNGQARPPQRLTPLLAAGS